jgi:hypothetical protein
MRPLLLSLPILMALLASGCTSFCLPGINCGTHEDVDDVIVIESLRALPDNVPPDGVIQLVAVVSNVANIDAEIRQVDNIHVELYDSCDGLFTITAASSTSGTSVSSDKRSVTLSLLRGEKAQVEWTLKAKDRQAIPVKTDCTLKIRAVYPYATRSITTLNLIDFVEMQRRINEGTFSQVTSYQAIGYGPMKPYVSVEGSQPIPVNSDDTINTVLSIQVRNRGGGFLSTDPDAAAPGTPATPSSPTGPIIKKEALTFQVSEGTGKAELEKKLNDCRDAAAKDGGFKLINKETTSIPCSLDKFNVGNVPVESTKTIVASLGIIENGKPEYPYWYEFRKELKVTVEPKF